MEITNTPHLYLTQSEAKAIDMLADGKSYTVIRKALGLSSLELCPLLATLRRRTGIADTSNPDEVQQYLSNYRKAIEGPGPTPTQLEAMQRVAGAGFQEHALSALGHRMSIDQARAVIEYEDGLRSVGIFAPTEREARVQLRMYFAAHTALIGEDRLTDKHIATCALYAEGLREDQISDRLGWDDFPPAYVAQCIQEGVDRLGVRARGRGVQRKLVAIALERIKRERAATREKSDDSAPVTMDDPAF